MSTDATRSPGRFGLYDEDYLGDAVYIGHDGFQLWLVTGDGNNNRIALDDRVLAALDTYRARLWDKRT